MIKHTLTNTKLLYIWEVGFTQHPLDRALTILEASFPNQTRQALAQLPIGRRDSHLLTLHEQAFGPGIVGQARCPACQEQVEFSFNTTDIRVASTLGSTAAAVEVVTEEGHTLVFRLPNSFDLAAIVYQSDLAVARRLLAERCFLQAGQSPVELTVDRLSERTLALVATHMAAADPQAEIVLAVACPACGNQWQLLFDIASFLWAKIETQARRLLREVHILARTYGWCEADILALSPTRRQFYLEIVST